MVSDFYAVATLKSTLNLPEYVEVWPILDILENIACFEYSALLPYYVLLCTVCTTCSLQSVALQLLALAACLLATTVLTIYHISSVLRL